MDLAEAEKRDIKSLEDKLEVFAEDIENSVDSGRASDRAYVDEKIKTMQKHGISGAALEDIATLQHKYEKINFRKSKWKFHEKIKSSKKMKCWKKHEILETNKSLETKRMKFWKKQMKISKKWNLGKN